MTPGLCLRGWWGIIILFRFLLLLLLGNVAVWTSNVNLRLRGRPLRDGGILRPEDGILVILRRLSLPADGLRLDPKLGRRRPGRRGRPFDRSVGDGYALDGLRGTSWEGGHMRWLRGAHGRTGAAAGDARGIQ